jgi:hypothetical protein
MRSNSLIGASLLVALAACEDPTAPAVLRSNCPEAPSFNHEVTHFVSTKLSVRACPDKVGG